MSEFSRRERKKHETHQRLLEAAWDLFRHKGYDDTAVEEITDAADVAKGTFFNYFESKETLLGEVVSWQVKSTVEQVLAGQDASSDRVMQIKRVIVALTEQMRPDGDLARLLFHSRVSEAVRHESIHRLGDVVQGLVVQAQAVGEIRSDVEAELVTRLMMTCVFFSSSRWHQAEVKFSLAERLIELVDVLLGGLAGPQWRKK